MTTPTTATAKTSTGGIVLEGQMAALREREIKLLIDLADHIARIGAEGQADRARLRDAADDLRDMFLMVVVIGEFNAGKSSFVNAIIGEQVLPMGITPTTDMIEVVKYAPTPTAVPEQKSDALRIWGHPNVTFPGVVVVDTPGTGSVFQKHEQVAKDFLHRSDLVIFVISAKRAFAETERLYLELAKNYGKKIIVVVNQVDLLDDRERSEVKNFVQRQLDELLGIKPPIFMVSAKKALIHDKPAQNGGLLSALLAPRGTDNSASDWGISDVRRYLRDTFEQVPPAQQKLKAPLALARTMIDKYTADLNKKLSLIGQNTTTAEDLKREISNQATGLDSQLDSTLKEVTRIFEGVRQRGSDFIDKNIRVLQAALRGVKKADLQQEFERTVIADTAERLRVTQETYMNALVDSGRAYWRGVVDRLSRMETLLKEEAPSMDAAAYADQRAALQSALATAGVELGSYADQGLLKEIQTNYEDNVRSFAAYSASAIGGLVALILAIATPGVLAAHPLAVIGAVIGTPVFLIGGGVAVAAWLRAVNGAKRKLNDQTAELEKKVKDALNTVTISERNRLTQYGGQILAPVFSQLAALGSRYRDEQSQLQVFTNGLDQTQREIDQVR